MANYFLVLGSGMFYDGNHTYLIEPEENDTSQVSAPSVCCGKCECGAGSFIPSFFSLCFI